MLVPSLAHNSRYDHSGSEIADMLPPEHNKMDVEGVTTVVVSTEQNSEAQVPLPIQPNPQPCLEGPGTAYSIESGPSRDTLSGEQRIGLVDSSLPQRWSAWLTKKRN